MEEWLRCYNGEFNEYLKVDDIHSWAIDEYVKPEAQKEIEFNGVLLPAIFKYLQDPDLYEKIELVNGAKEGIDYIRRRGHDIVIVSSCVINQTDMKMNWLIKHRIVNPHSGDTLKDFIGASNKDLI